ncbi:hypothetical protein ACS0PU_005358 [Formica fusca]
MPRCKIERTLEEEEQFRQRRLEKNAENQRRRRQNAKTVVANIVLPKTVNQESYSVNITSNVSKYMGRFNIKIIQHCMLIKVKIRLTVSFSL